MTITAVGGPNPSVLTRLQKQLAEDEQAMIDDVKKKAGPQTLKADQARITLDAAAISAEQVKEQQQAAQQVQAAQAKQTEAAARTTAAQTGASTPPDNATLDKYL